MRKLWLVACLVLCLSASFARAAEQSPIRDGAAVLAAQTQLDAEKLSGLVKDKLGLRLVVDIRHFLGGAEAQAYARRLLSELPDADRGLLLLVVVGEENYALAAGPEAARQISKDVQDTLLSKSFRVPFLNRQYDRAVGGFLLSLAQELEKSTGERLALKGLFGYAPPAQTAQPLQESSSGFDILDFMLGERVAQDTTHAERREREARNDKGLGLGSIILIGLVLSSIFGGKDRHGRRKGCGCGPLGWIFGVFGISKLFGWRR